MSYRIVSLYILDQFIILFVYRVKLNVFFDNNYYSLSITINLKICVQKTFLHNTFIHVLYFWNYKEKFIRI